VRWNNVLSKPYKLLSGVRQGGFLSPILFSVYVNDLLNKFKKYGCMFKGISVSAIMYADDIILMSPSVTELQSMLNVCCKELAELDICLNCVKSNAIRIGKRFNVKCVDLHAENEKVAWVSEAKYLGLSIVSGPTFKCNFASNKLKFYRASNAILSKAGNKSNTSVTLHLIASIAFPILMYSLEALALNRTDLLSLEHPWTKCFEKLFTTFDSTVVKNCQYYSGYLPLKYCYCKQTALFLIKLAYWSNLILRMLYNNVSSEDFSKIGLLCKCSVDQLNSDITKTVYQQFQRDIL